jgi:hypothetical protein
VSGENVVGIMVLVGLPALLLLTRAITKRFLDESPDDESDRDRVGARD